MKKITYILKNQSKGIISNTKLFKIDDGVNIDEIIGIQNQINQNTQITQNLSNIVSNNNNTIQILSNSQTNQQIAIDNLIINKIDKFPIIYYNTINYNLVQSDNNKRIIATNNSPVTFFFGFFLGNIGDVIEITYIGTTNCQIQSSISGQQVQFASNLPLKMTSNETRVFTKINTGFWRVQGYQQVVFVKDTFFVDSINGNNSTAEFQNPNRPFLDISGVIASGLWNKDNLTIELIGSGFYRITQQIPPFTVLFKGLQNCTLDVSNVQGNMYGNSLTSYNKKLIIDLPYGTIRNERAGNAGTSLINADGGFNVDLIIKCNILYWNSNSMIQPAGGGYGFILDINEIHSSTRTFGIYGGMVFQMKKLSKLICLSNETRLVQNATNNKLHIEIENITGNAFKFSQNIHWIIGDILTTNTCFPELGSDNTCSIHFNNSRITSTQGFNFCTYYSGIITYSGVIRDSPKLFLGANENRNAIRFINFSANFKDGSIVLYRNDVIIENSSLIFSTNTPFGFGFNGGNNYGELIIRNSTIEAGNNTTPLLNGGNEPLNPRTVKIAGLSTNKTQLSNNINNGTNIIQLNNY